MSYGKPKYRLRCLCHKFLCTAGPFSEGIFCAKTHKKLSKEQTYIATVESEEEVVLVPEPEAPVQRGCVID